MLHDVVMAAQLAYHLPHGHGESASSSEEVGNAAGAGPRRAMGSEESASGSAANRLPAKLRQDGITHRGVKTELVAEAC